MTTNNAGLKVYGATNPVPVELHHAKLGPRVPLKSNSPTQWIAASGMMLRAEIGSTAYGTNTAASDIDEMGVCVEPKVTVIGLKRFEVYRFRTAEPDGPNPDGTEARSRPGDLDLTVHSLRRFVTLCCQGNPSMLALLFVPETSFVNDYGEELRANARKFISMRAAPKFQGYLREEKLRLAKPGATFKPAMHALRLGMQGVELLERGGLTIPPRGGQLALLKSVRAGEHTMKNCLKMIEDYEGRLDAALATSPLPEEPEWHWVNTWLADVHLRHWRET